MYNFSTPTNPVFNNGGIQQCIPPNPIGNIVGIGTNGYNPYQQNMGGYYNGIYNNSYNPYLIKQQEELRKAQEKEQMRCQSDFMKTISKCANHYLGNDIDDEYLNKVYTPMELNEGEYAEDIHYYNTIALEQRLKPYNYYYNYANSYCSINEKEKERCPDTMSLVEYLDNAGQLYAEALSAEDNEKRKDLSQLYNKGDFNKLLTMHKNSGSNPFAKMFNPNATLDDMEITLPSNIKNEYQEKRQRFLSAIMNNNGGMING